MKIEQYTRKYYLQPVEIKDYNVMIDERKFFHRPGKIKLIRFDNIRKIVIGQGDDYTTCMFITL